MEDAMRREEGLGHVQPPLGLLNGIPDSQWGMVQRWWMGLSSVDRQLVEELTDEGRETCFFGVSGDTESVPKVFGGQFLPHDDAWRLEEWATDWREYLTDNPTLQLATSMCRMRHGNWVVRMDEFVAWQQTRFNESEWPPSKQFRHESRKR